MPLNNKVRGDDYINEGHILHSVSDALFDGYQNVKTATKPYEVLDNKCMAEDDSNNDFLISKFPNYNMVKKTF